MDSLSSEEQITLQTYDELVANGALPTGFEKYHPMGYWRIEMEHFHRLLPSGRIIEIGSGGGQHAQELISLGYDYIGTDASAGMVEVARKRLKGVQFYQQVAENLDFPVENKFDGFWAAAVLLHIPKSQIDTTLSSIKSVVRQGGVGFISLLDGEGERLKEELWDDDTRHQRFFAYWSRDGFSETLDHNGYKILDYNFYPDSKSLRWHCFFVQPM